MSTFWVALGTLLLVLGLLDVFLTALNYDEAGFLVTRLCALQWYCLRSITRRLSRQRRPIVLRQTTGLNIMLSLTTWLGCVVIGYGLMYYGLMSGGNFQYDGRNLSDGLFSAMYLSAAQLATVGTSQISPQTDPLRALTILETLTSVGLVSLVLTFLLGVYQVLRDLRTLSSNFYGAESEAGDPVANLRVYFPQGRPIGLDGHLAAISESFWSYTDGLRLHHVAYYFQSGRDQFALPYVLHMLGGMLAALRWGLPSDHDASLEPLLARLSGQFDQFADYLHDQLGWTSTAVPEIVSFDEFSAAYRSTSEPSDVWLGRFLRLNRDMARLVGIDPAGDASESYERYRRWLPFVYRTAQLTAAVSRDLDYQPLFRSGEIARMDDRTIGTGFATGVRRGVGAPVWWRPPLDRWVMWPDPGLIRLTTATSAVLAALFALASLDWLFTAMGVDVFPAAMFGGIVGMLGVVMPHDSKVSERKLTTILMVLPAIGAVALGAAAVFSFALTTVILVLVVLLGVWIGGLGQRFAALGQMAFMSYYFALLLHIPLTMLPLIALAAAGGVIWAYLLRFVLLPEKPDRLLHGGLAAFHAQLVTLPDPLIDAVSAARWDPDIRRRVRADMRHLHRCAALLQGRLRTTNLDSGAASLTAPGELRQVLFETELAAGKMAAAAQRIASAGAAVPIALRAQLAGLLDRAKDRLRLQAAKQSALAVSAGHDGSENNKVRSPEGWPKQARQLHNAVDELLHAARTLGEIQAIDLADPHIAAREVTADAASLSGPPSATSQASAPSWGARLLGPAGRQAIQAATATGLALLAGAAVTSSHQYWAALAAFVVLGGTATIEETMAKGLQRVIGTVAGAIIGFGVAIITGAHPFVVLPLLAMCVFAATYLQPVSQSLNVFWLTLMLSLLYEFLGELNTETLAIRVLETVIGAGIALGVATFLLPIRTRQKVNSDWVAFLKTLDGITQTCLKKLAGAPRIEGLSEKALTLDQRYRQLDIRAEPLRRLPGALGLDGIERQLTAAAALSYYAQHLIKAVEVLVPSAKSVPASSYAQLATITGDNISALIQILSDELPGPMHGSEDVLLQPDASRNQQLSNDAEHEAMQCIARINETVLTVIEDLTQDTQPHPNADEVTFTAS